MSAAIEDRIRDYALLLDDAATRHAADLTTRVAPPESSRGRRPRRAVSAVAVGAASLAVVVVLATRSGTDTITTAPLSTNAQPDPSTTGSQTSASVVPPEGATWTDIAPSPMTGREDSAVVWTGTEFLVWGGRVADFLYQQGAAYDPASDTWREITPNQWAGVGTATVWTGTQMVVLFKNGGVAYDPATDTWSEAAVPAIDIDQGFEAASWTGTQVLAIGARTNDGGATAFVATTTLVPGSSSWHAGAMSDIPWSADLQFAATPTGYAVWRPMQDGGGGRAWTYDVAADTWTELPQLTLDGDRRIQSSLAVSTTNGWTVVLSAPAESADDTTLSSVAATLDGSTWRSVDLPPITPTQGVSIGNGRIIVFGFSVGSATAMEIDTNGISATWNLHPQATTGQALAWNGTDLFVWGGRLNDRDLTARGRILVP